MLNIIIVNPFGIGDCLFTTPLIHTLKDAFPAGKLGFLCNKRAAPLLKNHPFIDQIFIYERDDFRRLQSVSWFSWFKEFNSFIRQIKKARFDLAIDLSLASNFGFFLWLSGIKRRIGYNYKNRGWLLTDSLKLDGYENRHIVEYYSQLLKLIPYPSLRGVPKISIDDEAILKYINLELYLGKDDEFYADNVLKSNNTDKAKPIVTIAPGGGASWGKESYLKYWPAESYKALIHKILDKYKATVIILGDLSDKELFPCHCEPAIDSVVGEAISNLIDLRGQTTLGQSAALINKANLFIGNDGGLLHMAVALKKKTISFFGPVDPRVYGAYPQDENRHIVLRKTLECSPCYRRFRLSHCERDRECLVSININEALEAVDRLWN